MTARISSSVARATGGLAASSRASSGDRLVEQVLGQRQEDRAGPAAERLADRLGHGAGDLVDRARLDGPLGEAAEGRHLVDLLERLAAADRALDLADDREHRGRILSGGVDPDGEVGRADRARPEAHRRPPGQLAVRLGHERRGAFVAGRDDADAGPFERVEEAEEGLAGHREGVPDAGRPERVGDEPADGPRPGVDDRLEVGWSHGVGRSAGVGELASASSRPRRSPRARSLPSRRRRAPHRSSAPRRPVRRSCSGSSVAASGASPAAPVVSTASPAGSGGSGGAPVRMRVRRRRPRWSARRSRAASSSVMATALLRSVGPPAEGGQR